MWAILTEADNRTPSFIRIGAVICGTVAVALVTYSTLALGNAFDASGFMMGAATLMGGSGFGARMAEGTNNDGPVG